MKRTLIFAVIAVMAVIAAAVWVDLLANNSAAKKKKDLAYAFLYNKAAKAKTIEGKLVIGVYDSKGARIPKEERTFVVENMDGHFRARTDSKPYSKTNPVTTRIYNQEGYISVRDGKIDQIFERRANQDEILDFLNYGIYSFSHRQNPESKLEVLSVEYVTSSIDGKSILVMLDKDAQNPSVDGGSVWIFLDSETFHPKRFIVGRGESNMMYGEYRSLRFNTQQRSDSFFSFDPSELVKN